MKRNPYNIKVRCNGINFSVAADFLFLEYKQAKTLPSKTREGSLYFTDN